MTEKNRFERLLFILILTWMVCMGLYWLPDDIVGFRFKKVDLLSEIRFCDDSMLIDSFMQDLSAVVLSLSDSASALRADSIELEKRNSVYTSLITRLNMDTANLRIRDFSAGHTGLRRFFGLLNKVGTLDRPVRVAFLGDSFIEGDIMVADFRSKMQAYFGGRGVGFVPITSNVDQYRPTISQHSKGWNTHSIMSNKKYKYVLSGLIFDAASNEASLSFKTTNDYPGLEEVSSLKFIYSHNPQAEVQLVCNRAKDTVQSLLPATDTIMQFEVRGRFTDGHFRFSNASDLQALGIVLEDNKGIVVDNFSLRGNSGTTMVDLDINSCRAWNKIRSYDLIIIQYGLNVATENARDYKWYRDGMEKTIRHLRECFPDSDILLLGVSDRSHFRNGAYRTMPSVVELWKVQYKTAEQMGLPFWSIFHAMGGENSMVRFVKKRWASKDYTHLSFRGGREIATALFDALILEKRLYDEMEESVD